MAVPGMAAKPFTGWLLAGFVLLAAASCAWGRATGSGFFVTADGYFVTSYQLVVDAEPVMIRDGEGRTLPARIVAVDPGNGLALLKAEGIFAAIPIAPSGALKVGDRVFAAKSRNGDEPGADGTLAAGTVSGVGGPDGARNRLRVTIPVGPAESGAPLLTADGDAVGVMAAGRFPGQMPEGSGAVHGEGGYAVRSESVIALIGAEQPALAQLLPPGALRSGGSGREAGDVERAIGIVVSGQAEPPVSAPPDDGEILVAEMSRIGNHALLEGDYESAYRWLREAALRGDAKAQTALGGMYRGGQGVARDDAEAVKWYRRAAAQGVPEARAQLGLMYARGDGVASDEDQAVQWLRQAAEDGSATGQNALGVMYRDGRGVYRDDAKAVNWFRLAARQGDPAGQNNFGVMLRDGRGVERDEVEATWWFRRAADQRNADAQTNLGLMHREGRGVRRDESEAVKWFRRAAEQDHALAEYYLGVSYAEGRGISRSRMEAAGWLNKSARQGFSLAQDYLRGLEE